MNNNAATKTQAVKTQAQALGFDACGVAAAGDADPKDHLGQWLAQGRHADMDWMARTRAVRQDVFLKVPGARSVVALVKNYYHPRPEQPPGSGKVARYAWGRDYHNALRKPLKALAGFIDTLETGASSYASVDSGPVLERTWAARAGVGWIGKNSLLLRRDLGSWFFLATIITTVDLEAGAPAEDHCGTCRLCIDACPTQAIVAPEVVDSNLCISYQTIENHREIPEALQGAMGDWVFGCDICQEACPWNRFATEGPDQDFRPREGVAHPDLDELAAMPRETFDQRFAGTPVRRAQHAGMVRNAKIARKYRSLV